jgi:hypothetical protein
MMVGQEGNVLNAQGNVGAMSNESDQMNAFGNYITFLKNVSPEEKQSPQWAMDMASAQTSYNDFASDLGKPTQSDNGSTNPLVAVLMAAMKAAQHNPSGGMRLTLSRQIIKCPVQNRYCSIDGEWYVH